MSRYANACMLCGRDWDAHHDFQPRYKACACHPYSWDGAEKYAPVCHEGFMPSLPDAGRCANCKHEEVCHAKKDPVRP